MTEKRNLSGIYFRHKTPEGTWESRVFEDLPEQEQDAQMQNRGVCWLKSLAKQLAKRLRQIGDEFDIIVK